MEPPVANYTRILKYYNPYRKTLCCIAKTLCNLGDKILTATLLNFAILVKEAEHTRYQLITKMDSFSYKGEPYILYGSSKYH